MVPPQRTGGQQDTWIKRSPNNDDFMLGLFYVVAGTVVASLTICTQPGYFAAGTEVFLVAAAVETLTFARAGTAGTTGAAATGVAGEALFTPGETAWATLQLCSSS